MKEKLLKIREALTNIKEYGNHFAGCALNGNGNACDCKYWLVSQESSESLALIDELIATMDSEEPVIDNLLCHCEKPEWYGSYDGLYCKTCKGFASKRARGYRKAAVNTIAGE